MSGTVPVSARSASLYLVGFLLFEHVLPAVDASVGVGPSHVRGTRCLLSAVGLKTRKIYSAKIGTTESKFISPQQFYVLQVRVNCVVSRCSNIQSQPEAMQTVQ
jgi:hypothetical protein